MQSCNHDGFGYTLSVRPPWGAVPPGPCLLKSCKSGAYKLSQRTRPASRRRAYGPVFRALRLTLQRIYWCHDPPAACRRPRGRLWREPGGLLHFWLAAPKRLRRPARHRHVTEIRKHALMVSRTESLWGELTTRQIGAAVLKRSYLPSMAYHYLIMI